MRESHHLARRKSAVGLVPDRAAVPALLAVAGAGGILTEVAGRLLLQRSTPTRSSAGCPAG